MNSHRGFLFWKETSFWKEQHICVDFQNPFNSLFRKHSSNTLCIRQGAQTAVISNSKISASLRQYKLLFCSYHSVMQVLGKHYFLQKFSNPDSFFIWVHALWVLCPAIWIKKERRITWELFIGWVWKHDTHYLCSHSLAWTQVNEWPHWTSREKLEHIGWLKT